MRDEAPAPAESAGPWLDAAPLWLALAIVLVWSPALGASFQFDDWNVIVRDPRVQSFAAWFASMPGMRPVLKLSYAINHELGAGPAGFRAMNIALHAANAALLFAVLRRIGRALGLVPVAAAGAALIACTVFALHPVQTEAVTYASGRSSSLAATAALGALWLWLRAPGAVREWRWIGGSVVVFAVALGVKETTAALPLLMALWLWIGAPPPRRGVQRLAPYFGLLLAVGLGALALPAYRELIATGLATRPVGANLLVQAQAIVYLAAQLLRLGNVNPDPMLDLSAGAGLAAGVLVLGALATAIALRRRLPAVAFGLLWFFAWLAPTNSLLARLDVVNDRQLYLALAGPAWLLGIAIVQLARRVASAGARTSSTTDGRGTATAATLAALAIAVPLAFATLRQNRAYADEITFWQDVTRKSPRSARAAGNLGYAYALACRDAEARREFDRALALDPGYWQAGVNRRLLREGALFAEPPPCAREARH